jgi:GAF domain-containing protein
VQEIEQISGLDPQACTAEAICAKISRIFHVQETEVALLELRGKLLNFVYPPELSTAGAIPITSSAVAARTATTKRAELFNSFAEIRHSSVFELVKLGSTGLDAQVIQKLMSAPILASDDKVLGVIQVSRKGPRPAIAGPDFTPSDMAKLELVARQVAKLMMGKAHVPW